MVTEEARDKILAQVERDVEWFRSMNLIDYSLLVGNGIAATLFVLGPHEKCEGKIHAKSSCHFLT